MESTNKTKRVHKSRTKKRRFRGNKYTKVDKASSNNNSKASTSSTSSRSTLLDEEMPQEAELPSTSTPNPMLQQSSSFLKLAGQLDKHDAGDNTMTGYRLYNIESLLNFINLFSCPHCLTKPSSESDNFAIKERLNGVSSELEVRCKVCRKYLKLNQTENINLRFQFAMYGIGCHESKSKRFLSAMDMPTPVSSVRAAVFKKRILKATELVAKDSMLNAAAQLKDAEDKREVTVSCDGTWQRRGFSSKNGVSTCLTVSQKVPSKVLDVDILSNFCHSCSRMMKKFTKEKFDKWFISHKPNCKKNHEGSAGSMEPEGLKNIFSESLYELQYTGYLGDGDSKSFKQISEHLPPIYAGKPITKLECCGHVQKRMGKKLLELVEANKNKIFKEGGKTYKGIGGVGRLTKKAIKRIQGHYGGAIRSNVGNLEGMRKAIWGIFNHRKGDHNNCGSWCTGQIKNQLPDFVMNLMEPVFTELSSDNLLMKCLHGGTQNANESFHHIIWEKCPKNTFVGLDRLKIGVYEAVIVFNEGELGKLPILENLGLKQGYNCISGFKKNDEVRIKAAEKINNQFKQKKSCKKAKRDPKDDSYVAGGH